MKPYLVALPGAGPTPPSDSDHDAGGSSGVARWGIVVPEIRDQPPPGCSSGNGSSAPILDLEQDVFVARADLHHGSDINAGIAGKKGLLLTPGLYVVPRAPRLVGKRMLLTT